MGRRCWLNSGSYDAATNIAFMYSLYENCKMNDIDFGEYVEDILTRMMTGDDADGVYECECKPDGTMYHGFSLKVEVPKGLAILECITPEIFSKGRLLANKCLKMYLELHDNPPFPAWRDGLDEVWN